MAFKPPKRFKRFKIYLKRANLKIALGFRFAQTLLNLAFARFVGAIFGSYFREFEKKQKQDQKQLGIRFAHKASLLASLEQNFYIIRSHPFGMLCSDRVIWIGRS